VCATIEFGSGVLNPLIASFPDPFVLPLETVPELVSAVNLLFSKAFSQSPARRHCRKHVPGCVFAILEDMKSPPIESMNGVAPFAHDHIHQDEVGGDVQNR